MASILIETRPQPGVAWLRLNRPEVLNVLSLALRRTLAEHFMRLDADATVQVIVLSGAGKSFCAGADLHEYVDADPAEIMARRMDLLWGVIARCKKPILAAVQGHALGGGCELAMHADILIAGRGASFGQPEVKVGIIPGGGATQRLTRSVGKAAAMNILLRGRPFCAEEALRLGLVSEVVDDAQVESHALAVAQELAALPALALRLLKEAVLASMNLPLDAGLDFERQSFHLAFSSPDKTEGMRARLEKRAANFNQLNPS